MTVSVVVTEVIKPEDHCPNLSGSDPWCPKRDSE